MKKKTVEEKRRTAEVGAMNPDQLRREITKLDKLLKVAINKLTAANLRVGLLLKHAK